MSVHTHTRSYYRDFQGEFLLAESEEHNMSGTSHTQHAGLGAQEDDLDGKGVIVLTVCRTFRLLEYFGSF